MVWAIVAATAVSAGVSIYEGTKSSGIANTQLGIEEDQEGKQDEAFNQLQALINNPDSFFSSAPYQAAFNQGTQAVARAGAAGGGNNTSSIMSGSQATALQSFGQSFGASQLLSQEQLLAGMSGTGFNPSGAASGAQTSVNASNSQLNSLAGLLSFFGASGTAGSVFGGSGGSGITTVGGDSALTSIGD